LCGSIAAATVIIIIIIISLKIKRVLKFAEAQQCVDSILEI